MWFSKERLRYWTLRWSAARRTNAWLFWNHGISPKFWYFQCWEGASVPVCTPIYGGFFWIPGKKSSFCSFPQFSFRITYSHTVHVWYIYLHENHKQSTSHVGKYIYHGWMVWEILIDKDCLHEIQVAKVDMLFLGFLFGQNSKKWAVVWQHSFFDIYFKIDFMCIFAYQSPPKKKNKKI